jgi:hypothetical protein
MEPIEFPPDFAAFLKLLTEHQVEFLLIGGFAVSLHGYPRATTAMDVWVRRSVENADRVVATLRDFGFDVPELDASLFLDAGKIVRMGVAPLRTEVLTSIDGVDFVECSARSVSVNVGEQTIPVIGLDDLKTNKRASGRTKDLLDLENLP